MPDAVRTARCRFRPVLPFGTTSAPGRAAFSNAVSVEFRSVSPGILAFAGPEPRAGMLVHVNSETGETSSPVTAMEPARPGQPVVLWASGLGAVLDPDGTTAPVAGQPYPGEAGNVAHRTYRLRSTASRCKSSRPFFRAARLGFIRSRCFCRATFPPIVQLA